MRPAAEGGTTGPGVLALAVVIFLMAFLIRAAFPSYPSVASGDEAMHSVSAVNYSERGYFGPDNWYSPPLKHLLLYASMRLFGDNVYGWRMRNMVFGAATVALLFLMVRWLRPEGPAAFLAASLLAWDPLHLAFSRSTFEDIPAAFFLLCAGYAATRTLGRNGRYDWMLCGLLLGLAVSLRLYAMPAALVLSAAAFWHGRRGGGWGSGVRQVGHLLFPCAFIYLLVYLPWFHRGYGLGDWVRMQGDAYRELRVMSYGNFPMAGLFRELGRPATWFFQPAWVGFDLGADEGWVRVVAIMNNLPVWMLIPPAVLFLLVRSIRTGDMARFVPAVLFVVLYGFFLAVDRPIFLYSSLGVLPFGFVALSDFAGMLPSRLGRIGFAVLTIWGLCLYPLAIGLEVPSDLYQPLIEPFRIISSVQGG